MKLRVVFFIFIISNLNAEIVIFEDDFTLAGQQSPGSLHDPSKGMQRQGGLHGGQVSYIPGNPTLTEGSRAGIEASSSAVNPQNDVLLIQNLAAVAGFSMYTYDLSEDFIENLSGKLWTLSYTVRVTTNITGAIDDWLAIAYGGDGEDVDAGGSGNDVFSFGIRSGGQWLLWYRDVHSEQRFVNGQLSNYEFQQLDIKLTVDERIEPNTLTVEVTPLGEQSQTVVQELPISQFTAQSGHVEFRASAYSAGTPGQVLDARIDDLQIVTH